MTFINELRMDKILLSMHFHNLLSDWLMLGFGLVPTAVVDRPVVDLQYQVKNSLLHDSALVLFPTIFHLFLLQG